MEQLAEGFAAYFTELDPKKRLKILNGLADADKEPVSWCRRLYAARYTDSKRPGQEVDLWLLKFIHFPVLFRQRKPGGGRILQREVEGAISDLMLDRTEALSDMQKQLLALEYQNVARRYLFTCTDPQYGSTFFGLKKASAEEKRRRACREIWESSHGIALAAGAEQVMKPWCDAVYRAYLEFDPDGQEQYEKLDEPYGS